MRLFGAQKGDTIVEVLVCIAVVSAVLGSAYAVVGRTSNNSQQAREHSQALKVAESQLEVLKNTDLSSLPNDQFCFKKSDHVTAIRSTAVAAQLTAAAPITDAAYVAECKYPEANAVVSDRYWTTFTKAGDTYKVHITWDGATGGKDSVELAYRAY